MDTQNTETQIKAIPENVVPNHHDFRTGDFADEWSPDEEDSHDTNGGA